MKNKAIKKRNKWGKGRRSVKKWRKKRFNKEIPTNDRKNWTRESEREGKQCPPPKKKGQGRTKEIQGGEGGGGEKEELKAVLVLLLGKKQENKVRSVKEGRHCKN